MRQFLSRHLLHFTEVYDQGSIRAAASVIGISQPALSKSIKQFEDLLQYRLFERERGGVSPTPFADVLRRRANAILRETEYAMWELDSVARFDHGQLRLGVGPVWSMKFLPDILPAFCARFPNVKLDIQTGSGSQFYPMIRDGEIDIYLGARSGSTDASNIVFISLIRIAIGFFAREEHPIFQKSQIDMKDLFDYPWVGFSHQEELVRLVERSLIKQGAKWPGIALSMESYSSLAKVASQCNHIALITDALETELQDAHVVRIPLSRSLGELDTGLLCRESLLHYAPVRFLVDECRARFGNHTQAHAI